MKLINNPTYLTMIAIFLKFLWTFKHAMVHIFVSYKLFYKENDCRGMGSIVYMYTTRQFSQMMVLHFNVFLQNDNNNKILVHHYKKKH